MTRYELKAKMVLNARAYNKTLTDDYLDRLTIRQLMSFVGPLERSDFAKDLIEIENGVQQ